MFANEILRKATKLIGTTLSLTNNCSIILQNNIRHTSKKPQKLTLFFMLFVTIIINQSLATHITIIESRHNQFTSIHPLSSRSLLLQSSTPATEPPDFEEPIGNHSIALGKDAQLSCKINNLGNFRTAWLRVEDKGILTIHNNVITRNYRVSLLNNDYGKNFVLTIKNVQPSDKGGYMCQINSVPMKYAIGYLDVLTPPVFDELPPLQQGAVATGSSSLLSMLSDGSQADQAAIATTNPPTQLPQASQVTVSEGSNATLTCRASGHPSPTITWRREDGQSMLINGVGEDDEQTVKFEGSSLSFKSVHRLNSGAYLCIASNGVQPSASKRFVLDVQYSPVITLPQTEVSAYTNQPEISLECLVNLNPLGSYHWVKLTNNNEGIDNNNNNRITRARQQQPGAHEDDQWLIEHDELMQSDKYEIVIKQMTSEKVQMILNIRQIEKKDFAWYKCIAKNSLGIQSNSVRFYESSSFSLNNMFRGGSSVVISTQQDYNNNNNGFGPSIDNNLQLNDEASKKSTPDAQGSRPQVLANQQQPHLPPRPLTKSSWIQRATGSPNRHGSSSTTPTTLPIINLLLFLLLSNCLTSILTDQQVNYQIMPTSRRHRRTVQ